MKAVKFLGLSLIFLLVVLAPLNFVEAQDQICESCPMVVGEESLDHFDVVDGDGNKHYVCCIGCALKLLRTYDTLHIETYCDWYGPNYPVIIDITNYGADTTVSPSTATTLLGGGCTGNRVAYNQTAADALLANGFSEYTMTMSKQPLPANTNVTNITARALTFAATQQLQPEEESPLIWIIIGIVAVVVVAGSVIAFQKLKKS